MNSSRSTCRPSTTRQRVSGVDRISPTGPQSQPQKMADTITERGERPVLWPYTKGSTTWPISGSATRNSAAVQTTMDQPESTAAASAIGSRAAKGAPM